MQIYFERYRIDVHEDQRGAWLEEAHVEETLWFENPVFVGETVVLRGRFADKYVRGGRGAVVLEGEARAADGRLIMGHRAIEYFAMDGPAQDTAPARSEPPMRRVRPEAAAAIAPAQTAAAGIRAGTPIATLEKTISFSQQLVFSTLDHPEAQRSVHTDLGIARRAGLRAPLVQGQQLACHVSESMTRFFGSAWYTSGWVRIKFLGGVCAGETIRVCGAVHSSVRREGSDVLELDVWIENEAGTIVAVANARAPPQGSGGAEKTG
jgi:acyl dehydratase